MILDVLTREDLSNFKREILEEITKLVTPVGEKREWLRSADVCKMLGISSGTLQNLRITGKLPFKKVNGTLFYSTQMIERMMNE